MLTFIVVNYNGEKYLKECLNSIINQTYRKLRVLVIDNGSTDGSRDILRNFEDYYSRFEVIRNEENLGFAKAANQGIGMANTKFVALVNNDAFLERNWAEEMLKAADDLRAGIFASKILFEDGRINSAGHAIYRGLAVMERGFLEKDEGQFDEPCYVAGACAAAAMYRRSLFEDVGLFDEDYFMYNEDVDLSLRALIRGWKILYVPTAIAYHLHSASTGFLSDFSVYYNSRNWVWSVVKNVPRDLLLREFPYFILRNFSSMLFFCLRGNFAILKSKIDAIRELRKFLEKRREVQQKVRFKAVEDYIEGLGFGKALKVARLAGVLR